MKEVTIKLKEKDLKEANEILSYYGRKLVPEENKKSQKVDIEPCEHEYEELKEEGPQTFDVKSNGGGYIFLHSSIFEDANMGNVEDVTMFANDTDIYLTDLRKKDIIWHGVEGIQNWGNIARNFAGDLDIKITDVFEGVNPYGDTVTLNISDHLINIHYDNGEEEPLDDDSDIKPQEFTVATDAESRATIGRKILEAADLCPDEDSAWYFNIFTNDIGTKLYITWKDDNYLEFNGEECKKIKEYFSNGKTSLRIKLGKPYTNYNVYTNQDLITIDVGKGYQIVENEETKENIQKYAEKKAEENKQLELAKQLIYDIFMDVEKIKKISGIDLTDLIMNHIKSICKKK